ncbi:MAG: hypothetical protein GX195_05205 [Firmicutes bacterium]|nr:hypothetical protein [Bacillota bacterium]
MPTAALDTLGAGYAFISAFLTGRLKGLSTRATLQAAAAYAAKACRHYGAFGHGLDY